MNSTHFDSLSLLGGHTFARRVEMFCTDGHWMNWDLTWLWVISLKISHYWENLLSIRFLYYKEKLFTTLVGSPLKSFVLLRGEVELAFEEPHFILDLSLWSTLYPMGIPSGKFLIVHGSPKKIFPRGMLPWRIIYLGDKWCIFHPCQQQAESSYTNCTRDFTKKI